VQAQQKKPNILVIWGDDIGWQNVSAYGMGTMGYTTPNIDRIGKEGIRFTDHYAQNSCTAGRAAFITGQYPIRSGLVTVGVPGDKLGLQAASPCLAEVLKKAEYPDYQKFAKNYPGGAEAFAKKFGTRGVLHTYATNLDDVTVDPRFGRIGKQKIEDTGPLTMERMEHFDATEVIPKAEVFMKKSKDDGK